MNSFIAVLYEFDFLSDKISEASCRGTPTSCS